MEAFAKRDSWLTESELETDVPGTKNWSYPVFCSITVNSVSLISPAVRVPYRYPLVTDPTLDLPGHAWGGVGVALPGSVFVCELNPGLRSGEYSELQWGRMQQNRFAWVAETSGHQVSPQQMPRTHRSEMPVCSSLWSFSFSTHACR